MILNRISVFIYFVYLSIFLSSRGIYVLLIYERSGCNVSSLHWFVFSCGRNTMKNTPLQAVPGSFRIGPDEHQGRRLSNRTSSLYLMAYLKR